MRRFFPAGLCQSASCCSGAGLTLDFLRESAIPWLSMKPRLLRVWKSASGEATPASRNPCPVAQGCCSEAGCQPPVLARPSLHSFPDANLSDNSAAPTSSSVSGFLRVLHGHFVFITYSLSFFEGQLLLFFTVCKVWLDPRVWMLKRPLK